MPLDSDTIKALLEKELTRGAPKKKAPQGSPHAAKFANQQIGPLRLIEDARRCVSRGCGSMTFYTVQGIPYCGPHALNEMNLMLVAQGFKGIVMSVEMRPTQLSGYRRISTTTQYKLDLGWTLENFECIHGIKLTKECSSCAEPEPTLPDHTFLTAIGADSGSTAGQDDQEIL